MTEGKRILYENVKTSDLIIDAIYCSPRPRKNGYADDVLTVMLHNVKNTGGFRIPHRADRSIPYIGLHLTDKVNEWPDSFDYETGILTYYGDNRKGGKTVENTPNGGNKLMRQMFDDLAIGGTSLENIPPIFVFQSTGEERDVRFLGLAVPGVKNIRIDDIFGTVWRNKDGVRFPNYIGKFTILDLKGEEIKRQWLEDLMLSNAITVNTPNAWKQFLRKGLDGIDVLAAPSVYEWPGREAQLPSDKEGKRIIEIIQSKYGESDTVGFERFAARLLQIMDGNFTNVQLTRPWRDGGRDATADYIIQTPTNRLKVECAMEAKCYNPNRKSGVGVKQTSRLISRIKNRQFGVLITTSYIDSQAYKEVKEDGHPILFCTGKDIAKLLQQKAGLNSDTIVDYLNSI